MARKVIKEKNFLDKLIDFSENKLPDTDKENIIKWTYLYNNKNMIIEAKEKGFNYNIIADFANDELLQLGAKKDTKFRGIDIKVFCENALK